MVLSTILAAAVALQVPIPRETLVTHMYDPDKGPSRLMTTMDIEPLLKPEISPKHNWQFDWLVAGYVQSPMNPTKDQKDLRFLVYSQDRQEKDDPAALTAQMLLRLWDYNFRQLKLDHSPLYRGGVVDVYLCWGGIAGGEQRFDVDNRVRPPRKVNTIYLYDIKSFTDPMEMAREVAHEYGHAILPPVGGFKSPEAWANGYLGEKLYLRWIRDEMKKGRYGYLDSMNARLEQIDKWVQTNVDPLVVKAATEGPKADVLVGTGQKAMDAYLGLALYTAQVMPISVFRRSLVLNGTMTAKDYPAAIATAAEEPEKFALQIPEILKSKAIWIPLGKGKVAGATVIARKGAWAHIQPGEGSVTVTVTPVLSTK